MDIDEDKVKAYNHLCQLRLEIETLIDDINETLKVYFPEEHELSYQHWIPQIKTGLRNNIRWLPRGLYSMEHTLNKISDKLQETNNSNKGVFKYTK
jgi:enoyl reductase-like protein